MSVNTFRLRGLVDEWSQRTSQGTGNAYGILKLAVEDEGYNGKPGDTMVFEIMVGKKHLAMCGGLVRGAPVIVEGKMRSRVSKDGRFHNTSLSAEDVAPLGKPAVGNTTRQEPEEDTRGFKPPVPTGDAPF